ncbi:MAG: class I SAM-dependent methyltransferase [Pyrinomonadaceae bacterium]
MNFKNYFSTQAAHYAKHRPTYPPALFEYLHSVTPLHNQAWDCATGNGQAALGLAPFFKHVIATDASDAQIANATKHENVTYRVADALHTNIPDCSIDLITVAQALHWFELEKFYEEVRRVSVPEGILAVWSYNLLNVSPELDQMICRYYDDVVGAYWPPERKLIEDGYRSLLFPFEELNAPPPAMQAEWSLDELLGYLRSWSATQRFIETRGVDPLTNFADELRKAWDAPEEKKTVVWPLSIRVGIVLPSS